VSESFYFANGTLNEAKVKVLSRTYATAINGMPSSMTFDRVTGRFELTYEVDQSTQPATVEIYVNSALHYPNGVLVHCSLPSSRYQVNVNSVSVWVQDPAADGHTNIIAITARSSSSSSSSSSR
jgi:Glycoside hydrolase family 5 C-terminal domain